jgi:3-oxoacyl-[acyl-carrier-protein] synthase-3
MSIQAQITGWGAYVPQRIVTNDDLSKIVDTNDEWIVSRTGISERHFASEEESTASLATEAALQALQVAGLNPADLDLVIVASSSPEHFFPATACLVQDRIGAIKAGAFDLLAACSGFVFALDVAAQAIRSGSIRSAVVIGAETLTRFLDWSDRNTCVLFGDGAGAFVLQASDQPGGVLASAIHSDGSGGELLILPSPGSRHPMTIQALEAKLQFVQMNGREVFRFATRALGQVVQESIAKAGFKLEDIQWIIPHQANMRILEAAAKNLKVPMDRFVINVDRYGNTSTASIPIAVVEAVQDGRIRPGDKVVFVGFGAGLTWGAVTAQWSGPLAPPRRHAPTPKLIRLLARLRSGLLRLLRRLDAVVWGRMQNWGQKGPPGDDYLP